MLRAERSDLYVLPEMFTTGFVMQPEDVAEKMLEDSCPTLQWMKRMAKRLDGAVCGSVAVQDNGFYNRFFFVKPDGEVVTYDKRHLFSYGGEDQHYTAGNEPLRVEWQGIIFNVCICYDLRFPIWSRNTAESPYDVQLYVANWPQSRRAAWDILLRARAIENQCYVVAVNRVGDDPSCHYNGGSAVIDAYGRSVLTATDDKAEALTIELDMPVLEAFRQKFPVLKDRD